MSDESCSRFLSSFRKNSCPGLPKVTSLGRPPREPNFSCFWPCRAGTHGSPSTSPTAMVVLPRHMLQFLIELVAEDPRKTSNPIVTHSPYFTQQSLHKWLDIPKGQIHPVGTTCQSNVPTHVTATTQFGVCFLRGEREL